MSAQLDEVRLDEFKGHAAADRETALNGVVVIIGGGLEFWKAMAGVGALGSRELSGRIGARERYDRGLVAG
jgi:hypothetical protein